MKEILCTCGHSRAEHWRFQPGCSVRACGCPVFFAVLPKRNWARLALVILTVMVILATVEAWREGWPVLFPLPGGPLPSPR